MKFLWYLIKSICEDILDVIVSNMDSIFNIIFCLLFAAGICSAFVYAKTATASVFIFIIIAGTCFLIYIITKALFVYVHELYKTYKHKE